MTKEQKKLNKAIVLSLAANLLDQLVQVLDDQGFDIEPMDVAMDGVPMGTMTNAQITAQLRQISKEFCPIDVRTEKKDNTA